MGQVDMGTWVRDGGGAMLFSDVSIGLPPTTSHTARFFWVPANLLIFSVPIHLRLPVNHVVSLAWCCILSFWRG